MRVDRYLYWEKQPPKPSPRLIRWQIKIAYGWQPNSRIRKMGYDEAAEFYGIYIWEYLNILRPLLREKYERYPNRNESIRLDK